MRCDLNIDDQLLDDALEYGDLESISREVNFALKNHVKKDGRLEFLQLYGTIKYDENYDYKKERLLR